MSPPLEVLIMAGGEGRRLRPLTAQTPKPMLPVDGQPVLQHTLVQLREQGVEHVFLSVWHLRQVISDYFGDGGWLGIDIDYVVEQQPLGTAGAIGMLAPHSQPLLVVNGDVVTSLPVAALNAYHQECGAAITIGCVERPFPIPYGVIECGGPDVLGLREKPDVVLTVIAGVYVIAPEVSARVQLDTPLAMPDLIESVLVTDRVVMFPLPGPWFDIGTADTYARANQVIVCPSPVLPQQRGPIAGDHVRNTTAEYAAVSAGEGPG